MKSFYLSKTFWFNFLAVALAVAGVFGYADFQINEELVGLAVGIVNVVLVLFFRQVGTTYKTGYPKKKEM